MARKPGSASLAASLEVLAGAPLDARTVVGTKTDLTTAATYSYVYVGMIVSVEDEGNAYILTAADYTDSDNWKLIGSGAGGGVVEGYFNPTDNLFYEESTYETAITGAAGMLYVSLDTNKLYRYNGSIFVIVSDIDITVYQPAGSVLFANLPSASASTLGFVYDIQDDFVTTADFVEGAGKEYQAGTNVVIVNAGTAQVPVYKYDILSGRKETKEITLAAFNALSTAEKNNGVAYFVPDADVVSNLTVVGNKFDKANIYTVTERMIGSYLGKPLYQKVVDCGKGPNATFKTVSHGVSDMDVCVKCTLLWNQGSGATSVGNKIGVEIAGAYAKLNDPDKPMVAGYVYQDSIFIAAENDQSDGDYVAILQYTKTGDGTVSIGTENDYSTTEQMIGTWINGKPLYQKTISGTLSSAPASYVSIGNKSDLFPDSDAFISFNAMGIYNSTYQLGDMAVNGSNGAIELKQMHSTGTIANYDYYCTAQYTKTTD